MELNFAPRGVLEINDAKIVYRNFEGRKTDYNDEGKRNFSVVIPSDELAQQLINDKNKFGVGWNVKIKAPFEEGMEPFRHLKVNVSFNERGPKIYVKSGNRTIEITESNTRMLDKIDIRSVDLDIRPYDDEMRGRAFRSAYLQSMWVEQDVDRFASRLAEDEYPEE